MTMHNPPQSHFCTKLDALIPLQKSTQFLYPPVTTSQPSVELFPSPLACSTLSPPSKFNIVHTLQHRFRLLHHSDHYRHHLQHNQDFWGTFGQKVTKMPGLPTTQADFDRVVSVRPKWPWSSLGGCCTIGGKDIGLEPAPPPKPYWDAVTPPPFPKRPQGSRLDCCC